MPAKYVIVIPDGAADEPQESLGGKTAAAGRQLRQWTGSPARESWAGRGMSPTGSCRPATWPRSASSAMTPSMYYTGRAPLEAAAMGVALGPDDWAIRCNLMTIQDGRLTDFTAGHITSEEGRHADGGPPLRAGAARGRVPPRRQLSQPDDLPRPPGEVRFSDETLTDPPHDHPDQPAAEHLPRGPGADLLRGR